MQFFITNEQIHRDNRKIVAGMVLLVVLSAWCLYRLLHAESLADGVMPLLGVVFMTPPLPRMRRLLRDGSARYALVALDEKARVLTISLKDISTNIDLTQIQALRLKYKSGSIRSILLTTAAGKEVRFEGYEQLEALAVTLQQLTQNDRIEISGLR